MQFLRTGSSSGCGATAIAGAQTAEPGEGQPAESIAGSHMQPVPGDAGEVALYRGRADGIEDTYNPEQFPPGFLRGIYDQGFREGYGVGTGEGFAGDVVCGPHRRYPPGRARAPWGDNFWGGAREPQTGFTGAIIETRRGTVIQTRSSDRVRTPSNGVGRRQDGVAGLLVSSRVGSIPQTRGS